MPGARGFAAETLHFTPGHRAQQHEKLELHIQSNPSGYFLSVSIDTSAIKGAVNPDLY